MRIGIDFRMVQPMPTGVGTYINSLFYELFKIDSLNEYVAFHNKSETVELLNERFKVFNNVKVVKVRTASNAFKQYILHSNDLKKLKLDLLITDMWGATPSIPCPYFLTIHDLLFFHFPEFSTFKVKLFNTLLLKSLAFKANKIMTVSDFSKNDISQLLNISKDKIFVTYEAVSKSELLNVSERKVEEIKAKYSIKERYFIYIGNIRSHKNLKNLLIAFEEYKDKFSSNEKLVLIGGFDSLTRKDNTKEVLERLVNNKYKKDIIRVGQVSDEEMYCLLKGSIALVHPSIFEGFGIPVLDAMTIGVPVMSSNSASLPEVVKDAGILLNGTNPKEIADSMNRFSKDANLRSELSIKGKERSKAFSWDKSANILLNQIRNLLI